MFMAGCASSHTVILVPDPDGKVGKAEVTTSSGKQLLEKEGDMTHVTRASRPPSAVTRADSNYITVTFGDALAVQPLPPEKFLLFFETGTTTLVPESKATISTIIAAIKRRDAITIDISGHTDSVGTDRFNDRLSLDRAEMVKELLLHNGISPDRIAVSSHGKGNPLIPTPDGVPEPKNRRVEIVVH
jgi:outer membrane protein OmpA-like peptidoglycan-associated protein